MTKKEFYNILVEETGYQDSYEDFDSMTSTPEGRKEFYDILVENTGYEDDYEWFESVVRGESNTQPTAEEIAKSVETYANPYGLGVKFDFSTPTTTETKTDANTIQQNVANRTSSAVADNITPSAPKAEDISITKPTAMTNNVSVRPVSAIQKGDGTPYSEGELKAMADSDATTQVADPTSAEIEAEEGESQKPKEEEKTIDSLAEDLKLQFGEAETAQDGKRASHNITLPEAMSLPLGSSYAGEYDAILEQEVWNKATGGKELSAEEVKAKEQELSNMSYEEVVSLLGKDGMARVEDARSRLLMQDAVEQKATKLLNRLVANEEVYNYLRQFVGGNDANEVVAGIASTLRGDEKLGERVNNPMELLPYAVAKSIGIDYLFGSEAMRQYLSSTPYETKAMTDYGMLWRKLYMSGAALPPEARTHYEDVLRDVYDKGELNTDVGEARMKDAINTLSQYSQIKQQFSEAEIAKVLAQTNKSLGQYMAFGSIEDAIFSEAELGGGGAPRDRLLANFDNYARKRASLAGNIGKLQELEARKAELNAESVEEVVSDYSGSPWETSAMSVAGMASSGDMQANIRNRVRTGNGKYARELELNDASITLREKAQDIIEHGERDDDFVSGVYHGLVDKAKYGSNWDFGMSNLAEGLMLKNIVDKVDKGEAITRDEEAFLDSWATLIAAESMVKQGRGYKAGAVTAEAIPFMVEMLLSPIKGGSSAASKFARWAIKKYGTAVARKVPMTITRYGVRLGGDVSKGVGMTLTTGIGRTADEAVRRSVGEINPSLDEEGNVVYGDHEKGEKVASAIAKAIGSKAIEYHSELVGEYFAPLLKGLTKLTDAGMSKIGLGKVTKFFEDVKASDWGKMVGEMSNRTQWHGTLGEFSEEIVGGIENAIIVGDQTLDTDERTGVFNKDNLIDTYLGVAVMGAMINGAQAMGYKSEERRMQMERDAWSTVGERLFGGKWNELMSQIDGTTQEDISDVVSGLMRNKDYNANQKKAILRYAGAVASEREMLDAAGRRAVDFQGERIIDAQGIVEEQEAKGFDAVAPDSRRAVTLRAIEAEEDIKELMGVGSGRLAEDALYKRYLTTDPQELLIRASEDESLSREQRDVIIDYLGAKAARDGMTSRRDAEVKMRTTLAHGNIDATTNKQSGEVIAATLKNGRKVVIVDGIVEANDDGSVSKSQTWESLVVIDEETGEKEMVSPGVISTIDHRIDADELKTITEGEIYSDVYTRYDRDVSGDREFAVGERVLLGKEKKEYQVTNVNDEYIELSAGNEVVEMPRGEARSKMDQALYGGIEHKVTPIGISQSAEYEVLPESNESENQGGVVIAEEPMAIGPGVAVRVGGVAGVATSFPEDGKVIVETEDGKILPYDESEVEVVGETTETIGTTETTMSDGSNESAEVDDNGRPFIVSSNGTTTFGEITEDTGLPSAPIKLSEGYQDENGKGYGLAHIEANHGKQIRGAGFKSVEEFVKFVAENYDGNDIRVGNPRGDGNITYLIQVKDKYDNTLFIELSRDGSYWNVNSGGVFRKGYSDKKETVVKTEPQQPNNAVSPDSSLSEVGNEGISTTEPNGESPVSEGEDSENKSDMQEGGVNSPAIPVDAKGEPMYESAPVEATIADIYNDPDLDEDEADAFVQAKIDGATKRISQLEKKKPKMGESKVAFKEAKAKWREQLESEQASLAYWQGVQEARAKESTTSPLTTPQSYGQPPYQSRGAITPPIAAQPGGELDANGEMGEIGEISTEAEGDDVSERDSKVDKDTNVAEEGSVTEGTVEEETPIVEEQTQEETGELTTSPLQDSAQSQASGGLSEDLTEVVGETDKMLAERKRAMEAWLQAEEVADKDAKWGDYSQAIDALESYAMGLSDEQLAALQTHYGKGEVREIDDEISRRDEIKVKNAQYDELLSKQYPIERKERKGTGKLEDALSKDVTRPVMTGVYHDEDGYAVATDAKVLVADKREYNGRKKGKIIGKDGKEIPGNYPKWKLAIPVETEALPIDLQDLSGFIGGVKAKLKENGIKPKDYGKAVVMIKTGSGTIVYYPVDALETWLNGAMRLGATGSDVGVSERNGFIVAKTKNGVAMLASKGGLAYNDTGIVYEVNSSPSTPQSRSDSSPKGRGALEKQVGGGVMENATEAQRLATEAVITSLEASGIEVVEASDAMAEAVMGMGGVEMSAKKKRALETASVQEEHQPTVVSSADGAKVLNNLDNVATEYEEKSNQSKTFLGDVAKALGAERKGSGSQYVTFETKNGKVVTIRLSNHNATVSNFDNNGEADGISIVVSAKGNNGMTNDGDAHVVEHYYDAIKLRRAEGKPLADIVRSIKQALYSGEFTDTTGLAERQEVNLNEVETLRTPQGVVYGWTDGKKVYLTKEGMNPETPIHEYTHLWARAMMQGNAEGWQSVKDLLRGTPIWNEVMSDANYADIHGDEDAVASECLARLSGKENAKRMEAEARKIIDEAKGVFAKADAVTLVERMKKALQEFWNWVGKNLFDIKSFGSIEEVTDRVLWDLVNNTELETIDGAIEKQIIGERGASALDKADEATHRMDNLGVAREMEDDGLLFRDGDVTTSPLGSGGELGTTMSTAEASTVGYSDAEVSMANDPIAKVMGKSQRSKKQQAKFAERERKYMRNRVAELAEKMHLDNVEVVESSQSTPSPQSGTPPKQGSGGELDNPNKTSKTTMSERKARAKGWFDTRTGKIVINISNHLSVADVERTLLHEAVAHYGLRQLFGKQFDTFLDNVYLHADAEVRAQIIELAKKHGWEFIDDTILAALGGKITRDLPPSLAQKVRTATEEYLAGLAEDTNFEYLEYQTSFWMKIKRFFMDMLESIGWDYKGPELSDNELRYLLWRSYENMVNPGRHRSILGKAEDVAKQYALGVGNYSAEAETMSQVAEEGEKAEPQPIGNGAFGAIYTQFRGKAKEAIAFLMRKQSGEAIGALSHPEIGEIDLVWGKEGTSHSDGYGLAKLVKYHPEVLDNLQEILSGMNVVKRSSNRVQLESNTHKASVRLTWDNQRKTWLLTAFEKKETPETTISSTGVDNSPKGLLDDTAPQQSSSVSADKVNNNNSEKQENNESNGSDGSTNAERDTDEGILFRDGESDGTREEYNRRVRRPNRSGSVGKWDNLGWRMKEAYQDSMLSLKELQDVIAKKYGLKEIPSWMNAYLQENLMSSRNKAASDVYMRDFYNPMMKEVQALIKKGVKYEDLVNYMIAKHGLERNVVMAERDAKRAADEAKEKGEDWQKAYDEALKENRKRDYSGLTALTGEESVMTAEKEAEKMVEEFEGAHETDALWEKVNAATKETLRKSYEGGLMSKETYESTEAMYEHYIPLRGWDSDIASDVYEYLMSDRPLLSPALKTAKGRTSLADDPIATIGMMADSTIAQANRNKMKQAFYYFAVNNPSDVVTISKQWYVYDEVTKKWQPRSADIPLDALSEEIATIVEEFEARMEELARDGKAKRKSQGLDLDLRTVGREGEEHTVRVKVNGEEYCIYVNGSPRAAQALNGLTNPEMFNDALMKGTKKVNNYLAQVFTSKNPEFVFSNMSRDLMWATGAVAVKENAKYNVVYHKNINKIFWSGMMPRLVHRHMMGTLNMNNELDRYFEEFVRHGGETGYTAINSIDHYKRNIKRNVKDAQGKQSMTKKAWNGVFDAIEFMNRSAENMTRFAVYVTSREMGRDQARAAHDAKEITVNFNKKGSGELGARYLGGLYVFMNACIQSMANFARLTGKHPVKMTGALATMAGLGFMLPLLNRMLAEAMGDDDEYWNLPEWVRRNNLVFRIPGTNKFITLPISHELRPFYGIGEIAYSVMNEKEDAKEGLGKAVLGFSGMSPIDFTGNGGNVAVNLTPTAFQPVAQLIANVDYFGKPIFKDADYLEDYPEYTKAYKGTSPMLVSGTEFLNRVSGGDVVVAGGIDLNPDVIEHLVERYFGGAGKTVNKAIKGFSMIWDEDTREIRNIPIVNKFLQTAEERTYGSHTQKEFYEAMDKVEDTGHKLSGYSKQATMGSIEYAEKLNELINSPEYKEYKLAMGYKSAIKKLQNSLGNIDKTKEKEVSEAIQRLQKEMLEELPKTKAQDIDTVLDNAEEVKWGAEEKVETIFGASVDDFYNRKDAVNDAKEYGDTTALKKFIESGRGKDNK